MAATRPSSPARHEPTPPWARPEAKREVREFHRLDHNPVVKFHLDNLAFVALGVLAVWSWLHGWWPVSVACWLAAGHFGHIKPLCFHDAAHGTLYPNRLQNEAAGTMIGTLILLPLSVYRYVHASHHAYLNSIRDHEMWPFNDPRRPRWFRRAAAAGEIFLGLFYTPLLFLRAILAAGDDLPRKLRIRIVAEYTFMAAFWGTVLAMVHRNGWWTYFLVGYVAPVAVAGSYQTLRKYVEHLGLLGDSILANTRTVIDRRRLGEALSYSMQHVDYHGTHHRYAKIPFYNLPAATPYVYQGQEEEYPVFDSYLSAALDMLRALRDPKCGGQWRRGKRHQAAPDKPHWLRRRDADRQRPRPAVSP